LRPIPDKVYVHCDNQGLPIGFILTGGKASDYAAVDEDHLFAGSDGGGKRWATLASLIETCKLNNVEPYAWLSDVLERMAHGHPATQLDSLLPWNSKAPSSS